jgi:hypothetical protein
VGQQYERAMAAPSNVQTENTSVCQIPLPNPGDGMKALRLRPR